MKNLLSLAAGAGALAFVMAFQDVPNEARRTDIHTSTGTVRSYSPQGHIVIVGGDGAEHSFPLDGGARVADGVKDGQMVAVAWFTESTGDARVTSIAPFAEPPNTSSTSSAPPSKAYASATDGAAMSATPSGPMSETPRPVPTEGSMSLTPGSKSLTSPPSLTPTPARPGPAPTPSGKN